ncbi:MAG: hypothetical protein IKV25_04540 [Clostridia bacterium]|nr:hypothetical protein [Clostridia bacterium]
MNKNNKKNTKWTLSSLLNNNRFLLIISLVISFVLWIWVAIEQSPEVQRVINNVPVSIKYEDSVPEKLGLQIFGKSDYTIDITVTGKKYIVSSLKPEDFSVIANTNNADSSGKKNLKITVKAKEENSDFYITSYSDSEIEVFFDRYKEVEIPINVDIETKLENIVPENHKIGEAVSSVNTLIVSGPASIINQIDSINANIAVDDVLTQTTTKQAAIVALSKENTVVDTSMIDFSDNNVTVTLPVLKIVTLPTVVEFKNIPSYYANHTISYSVYPSSVTAAVPVDLVDSTKAYVVDTIDFSDIYNKKNTYNVNSNESQSVEFLDDNVSRFSVTVDASFMSSKTITIPKENISIKNNNNAFNVDLDIDSGKTVTIVGTAEVLDIVIGSDFYIIVDTSESIIDSNTKVLNGKVTSPANKQCWAVGDCDIKVSVK